MIGIIIYLSTLKALGHLWILIAIPIILYKYRLKIAERINQNLGSVWVVGITLLMLANYLIHFNEHVPGQRIEPFFILLPLVFLIGISLTKRDCYVFVGLVLLEWFWALFMQVPWGNLDSVGALNSIEVNGWSHFSSALAQKLLIAFLLVQMFIRPRQWHRYLLIPIVTLLMLQITANRTAIFCVGYFTVLVFIAEQIRLFKSPLAKIVVAITPLLVFVALYNWPFLDLTRRDNLWEIYLNQIYHSPIWGNGSFKLWEIGNHAHNSFLQTAAIHGSIVSVLMFLMILLNQNNRTTVALSTIILYSCFQYGIFWGVSVFDVFLFFFLFHPIFSKHTYSVFSIKIDNAIKQVKTKTQ